MKMLLIEIRRYLDFSQDELARVLGTTRRAIDRWESGHSRPGKTAQLRLYDICKGRGINLEKIVLDKIDHIVSNLKPHPDSLILYHGSKSVIKEPIAPISRARCDFGQGFYMGTDPYQALTLISDFEGSKFYVISLCLTGLQVMRVNPDIEWAMLVAYNRGKMDEARGSKLYEHYANIANGHDIIVGSIANDRMFYVLDNFFLGNITDKALVMSLSALKLGQQYAAITEKACSQIKIEAKVEFSYLERLFLRDLSESNRVKGINLANDICRDYRREGLFFDEIMKKA